MELGNLIFGHSRGNYPIDRVPFETKFGEAFARLLDNLNCDSYGYYMGNNKWYEGDFGGFSCERFEISPYYWGEEVEGLEKANFIYNFDNGESLEIRWYKYPFRDAYSNMKITDELFEEIMKECLEKVWELKA